MLFVLDVVRGSYHLILDIGSLVWTRSQIQPSRAHANTFTRIHTHSYCGREILLLLLVSSLFTQFSVRMKSSGLRPNCMATCCAMMCALNVKSRNCQSHIGVKPKQTKKTHRYLHSIWPVRLYASCPNRNSMRIRILRKWNYPWCSQEIATFSFNQLKYSQCSNRDFYSNNVYYFFTIYHD